MVRNVLLEALRGFGANWKMIAVNGLPLLLMGAVYEWYNIRQLDSDGSSGILSVLIFVAYFGLFTSFWGFAFRLAANNEKAALGFDLQFKTLELKIVLYAFAVGLCFIPIGFLYVFLTFPDGLIGSLANIAKQILAVAFIAFVLTRFSLIWIALTDNREFVFHLSWDLTKGRFWSAAGVVLFPTGCYLLVSTLAGFLLMWANPGSASQTAALFLPSLVLEVIWIGFIAFLTTILYRKLSEQALADEAV